MSEAAGSITVRVPLTIRRRPGRKTVVVPAGPDGGTAIPMRADPALVKALARAFRYQRLLDEGRYTSISEMAAAEKLDRGYLGRVLQLTLLAPDIVEAILDGRRPPELGLPRLLERVPAEWNQQSTALLAREPTKHISLSRQTDYEVVLSSNMLRNASGFRVWSDKGNVSW